MSPRPPRVLVIRRDNIGDLVCTLPLLQRLREAWPNAWIAVLVTSYNAEVLHGNPYIDEILTYQKGKHRAAGQSLIGLLLARLRQLLRLRRAGLDLAVLPSEGTQASARRMARLAGARRIVGNDTVPPLPPGAHEAERVIRILPALGLPAASAPAPRIVPRAELVTRLRAQLGLPDGSGRGRNAGGQSVNDPTNESANAPLNDPARGPVIGLHISARKPSQRWPVEQFVELVRRGARRWPGVRFVLFWAPGATDNPLHPGDDVKAAQILSQCKHLPLVACPTASLAELIAGLALTDAVVCGDGGHMHLAAGLGRPLVCLFGKSAADRWHPWGVPYHLLQPPSQDVRDVAVAEVEAALADLLPAARGAAASVG